MKKFKNSRKSKWSKNIFTLEELMNCLPQNYALFSLEDNKPVLDYNKIYWNLIAKPI